MMRRALIIGAGCVAQLAMASSPAGHAQFTERVKGTTVTLEMVPVPGVHAESIEPFWVSSTEVTWDLYDIFVYGFDEPAQRPRGVDAVTRPSKPYISMDRGFGHTAYPAISMSYHGAKSFCTWLSERTGRRYRLPTEREWRHLCTLAAIDPAALDASAWHRGNARRTTHPVGRTEPDTLGLHDLLGNASEWCTSDDDKPVTMGGSFRDLPERLGCAQRVEPSPGWNASDPQLPKSIWWLADGGFVGFRVVCETEPTKTGDDHDRPEP